MFTLVMKTPFFNTLRIKKADVVCLTGAGGKTTLLFRLAQEARALGYKVLVTTTTKMFMPEENQYDALDLSGDCFAEHIIDGAGIYYAASGQIGDRKLSGPLPAALQNQRQKFDLALIEADGAAQKPLKAWSATEPVIPEFTTKTIGILDIQTIGKSVCPSLIHRIELFLRLTQTAIGNTITEGHLAALAEHENGLFQYARGQRLIFINKVESEQQFDQARTLAALVKITAIPGSLHKGIVYAAA